MRSGFGAASRRRKFGCGQQKNRQARYLCTKERIMMTATLTYTLLLVALYFGKKAIEWVEEP